MVVASAQQLLGFKRNDPVCNTTLLPDSMWEEKQPSSIGLGGPREVNAT